MGGAGTLALESDLTLMGTANDPDSIKPKWQRQKIPGVHRTAKVKPSPPKIRKQAKNNCNQSFISDRGDLSVSSQTETNSSLGGTGIEVIESIPCQTVPQMTHCQVPDG